jgi:hypothetical protein
MQIFIRGYDGRTISMDVEGSKTVQELRGDIALRFEIRDLDEFDLCQGQHSLEDSRDSTTMATLDDYDIQKHTTVQMFSRRYGGVAV